jgi:hypothetical protein
VLLMAFASLTGALDAQAPMDKGRLGIPLTEVVKPWTYTDSERSSDLRVRLSCLKGQREPTSVGDRSPSNEQTAAAFGSQGT